MEFCLNETRTFVDPSTRITHSCNIVCDYGQPSRSNIDCGGYCPGLLKCLMTPHRLTTMRSSQPPSATSLIARQRYLGVTVAREAMTSATINYYPTNHQIAIISVIAISVVLVSIIAIILSVVMRRRNKVLGQKNKIERDKMRRISERSDVCTQVEEYLLNSSNGGPKMYV